MGDFNTSAVRRSGRILPWARRVLSTNRPAGCRIETGPDQSRDLAYGSQAESGAPFGAAEDLNLGALRRKNSTCG